MTSIKQQCCVIKLCYICSSCKFVIILILYGVCIQTSVSIFAIRRDLDQAKLHLDEKWYNKRGYYRKALLR
jgi:hypothetical protein